MATVAPPPRLGPSEGPPPWLDACRRLREHPYRWLVTGSAGFIGSHLTEMLLRLGQSVVGFDNFATGHRRNLEQVREAVGDFAWRRHHFVEGDLADVAQCEAVCSDIDVVLHQAALGSVPRSIEDPLRTHAANATGFVNLLVAARHAGVRRFVYAASSSTYGDHPGLPKVEDAIGRPLSPYAVTKLLNELYAEVFQRCYSIETIGLRYFNVFGPRQDPQGAYAAVIPRWVATLLQGHAPVIHGDGETTRDFCFIDNVVQANLLAATASDPAATGQVYNVAAGARTTLNELATMLRELCRARHPDLPNVPSIHAEFRAGDVRHSQADIGKARKLLGYAPTHGVREGLDATIEWYEAAQLESGPSQDRYARTA